MLRRGRSAIELSSECSVRCAHDGIHDLGARHDSRCRRPSAHSACVVRRRRCSVPVRLGRHHRRHRPRRSVAGRHRSLAIHDRCGTARRRRSIALEDRQARGGEPLGVDWRRRSCRLPARVLRSGGPHGRCTRHGDHDRGRTSHCGIVRCLPASSSADSGMVLRHIDCGRRGCAAHVVRVRSRCVRNRSWPSSQRARSRSTGRQLNV